MSWWELCMTRVTHEGNKCMALAIASARSFSAVQNMEVDLCTVPKLLLHNTTPGSQAWLDTSNLCIGLPSTHWPILFTDMRTFLIFQEFLNVCCPNEHIFVIFIPVLTFYLDFTHFFKKLLNKIVLLILMPEFGMSEPAKDLSMLKYLVEETQAPSSTAR